MVEKTIQIKNPTGLHAKPVSMLAKFISEFKEDIYIIKDDRIANAKSIVNILNLKISYNTEVILRVEGENEVKVLEDIIDFFANLKE